MEYADKRRKWFWLCLNDSDILANRPYIIQIGEPTYISDCGVVDHWFNTYAECLSMDVVDKILPEHKSVFSEGVWAALINIKTGVVKRVLKDEK